MLFEGLVSHLMCPDHGSDGLVQVLEAPHAGLFRGPDEPPEPVMKSRLKFRVCPELLVAEADHVVDPRAQVRAAKVDYFHRAVVVQPVPGLEITVGGHQLNRVNLDGGKLLSHAAQHGCGHKAVQALDDRRSPDRHRAQVTRGCSRRPMQQCKELAGLVIGIRFMFCSGPGYQRAGQESGDQQAGIRCGVQKVRNPAAKAGQPTGVRLDFTADVVAGQAGLHRNVPAILGFQLQDGSVLERPGVVLDHSEVTKPGRQEFQLSAGNCVSHRSSMPSRG